MSLLTTTTTWPSVLEHIRSRVSRQQFATWFQNLQATAEDENRVVVRVPHLFFKEWLVHNYMEVMREAFFEATGSRPEITVVIDEKMRRRPLPQPGHAPAATHPGIEVRGLLLNRQYTFDTFVVGPSNQLAHAAAAAVTASPGRTYNPLFIYGSVGLGKSHLLQAICHGALDALPNVRVAYLSCETFVNKFISAIQKNELPSFRDRYRQLDLLLLDDVQFLARAERSQEEFFHTFNDLYNAQKQIVLSSDQPPNELTDLQERLVSRFKSGLVARVDAPSYEMRVAILKRKEELRNVKAPDDVIEYIATIISSNIRELDGAITKVVGYASLLNEPLTLEVAKTVLQDQSKPPQTITLNNITREVTAEFNVRLSDLQSKKRTRSIVVPRQICMYLARSLTLLSLEEIGSYFGGRDHSTVLHSHDKISSEIASNQSLAATVEKIRRALGAPETDG